MSELERGRGGTALLEPVDELESTLDAGDDDTDYSGWHCISTDPFRCPAEGCTFVADFATAYHLIVVFSERDDPRLLDLASIMKARGRNPKIVEYEPGFGPCITYDQWEARGRPVHGIRREQ